MSFVKTEKQVIATQLQASKATHIMLYGGSRSGKTFLSLRNLIIRALKCKSRHVVLRLRFNHVKTSIWHDTLPKVLGLCFSEILVKWNKTDFFIEFTNGSQIWFGGLDDSKRVEKILGNEYSTIYLNECSQIEWPSVNVVLTRLAEKTTLKNKMFYDCNPPSRAHWTYKLFIQKVDPVTNIDLELSDNYVSLLMNPCDNLANINEDYIAGVLCSLSERERKRFELGEFLSDVEGALWHYDLLVKAKSVDKFAESVVAIGVDPAVTSNDDSDETGIVVCSSDYKNLNVLADLSLRASPDIWMQTVLNAYDKYNANYIVVETNQGGDLLESLIRTKNRNVAIKKVHAKKGKFSRAEPVVALYEQNRVYHENKNLDKLESQMLEYIPHRAKGSPDRIDALVWAATDLVINNKQYKAKVFSG
jgi:phage terminase large subunit-like protein